MDIQVTGDNTKERWKGEREYAAKRQQAYRDDARRMRQLEAIVREQGPQMVKVGSGGKIRVTPLPVKGAA